MFLQLLAITSLGQAKFMHLNIENGPFAGVTEIYQDKYGYMWFGTRFGLSKYDGYMIRNYTPDELSNQHFASATAQLIFEDPTGRLWIITDAGALSVYDRDIDRFHIINDSITSLRVSSLSCVQDSLGNFWIASHGAGLFRYNISTEELRHYTSCGERGSLPSNYLRDVCFDRHGRLWIGTTNGLCRYNQLTDDFTRYTLANNDRFDTYKFNTIRDIHSSEDDNLYIASENGLHIFNTVSGSDEQFLHDPGDANSLANNFVCKIVEDDHHLDIATYGGGLNKFDPVSRTFVMNWHVGSRYAENLSSNNIIELFIDRDKTLWIGTADNGVSLLKPVAGGIRTLSHRPNDARSLSQGHIRAIHAENDSILWIGLNGGGLNRLNIYTNTAMRYTNDPDDSQSLGHNFVSSIERDRNGYFWLALEGGGLNMFDPENGSFRRYRYTADRDGLSSDAVICAFPDSQDRVWTISVPMAIDILDVRQNKFHHVPADTLQRIFGSLISPIKILEHEGMLWFRTPKAIVVYDNTKNKFIKLKMGANIEWQDMAPWGDWMLLLDKRNTITKLKYNGSAPPEIQTAYSSSAKTDNFRSMVTDSKRHVWIMCDKMIVCIDLRDGARKDFPLDEQYLRSFDPQLLADSYGRIFFSRFQTIHWFESNGIATDNPPSDVIITDFRIFNKPVAIADRHAKYSIPKHISLLGKLDLPHDASFFSIGFSALEFYSPKKIQYAYKMEGFDKDWIYAGNLQSASYTNLDPGYYVFSVRASKVDGKWSDPSSIVIVIHPPVWATWWFIGLEIIFVVAVIILFIRYRISQSVKVERLRNKIATDLHDEVGSSLTRISLYSDMIDAASYPEANTGYLKSIGALSREVVRTMSDIVWSIDTNRDTAGELMIRMKDFAASVLWTQNIEVNFKINKVDERRPLDPQVRQNVYLIFKEAITNIVKHAKATAVNINIVNRSGYFMMEIKDNGVGIIFEDNRRGHGLLNMHKRAEMINARLEIINLQGATIRLTLDGL